MATDEVIVIGIDCATNPDRVGLARGRVTDHDVSLVEARVAGSTMDACIVGWMREADCVLLALDAPLGWPAPLAAALADHSAGEALPEAANALFRRRTDDVVARAIGHRPMDVGADRIARTAHATLELLRRLRRLTGERIPMAWSAFLEHRVAAIEVYPAGTLRSHGLQHTGYKLAEHSAVRRRILAEILSGGLLTLECDKGTLERNADVLDAAVCVVAAHDFLAGRATPPADWQLARREGWIWVRNPGGEPPP